MDAVWIEILSPFSSVGIQADGKGLGAGEIVQVSPQTARTLIIARRARLVEGPPVSSPPVAEMRKRTR